MGVAEVSLIAIGALVTSSLLALILGLWLATARRGDLADAASAHRGGQDRCWHCRQSSLTAS